MLYCTSQLVFFFDRSAPPMKSRLVSSTPPPLSSHLGLTARVIRGGRIRLSLANSQVSGRREERGGQGWPRPSRRRTSAGSARTFLRARWTATGRAPPSTGGPSGSGSTGRRRSGTRGRFSVAEHLVRRGFFFF